MNKEVLESESMYANINVVQNNTSTVLRVATFCIVTAVDKLNKTINAKPMIQEKVEVDNNKSSYMSLPELMNVPYCTNMKSDPKEGDFCICIHLDRSIRGFSGDDLKNNRGKSTGLNKHKLSDCVAIVGFNI